MTPLTLGQPSYIEKRLLALWLLRCPLDVKEAWPHSFSWPLNTRSFSDRVYSGLSSHYPLKHMRVSRARSYSP